MSSLTSQPEREIDPKTIEKATKALLQWRNRKRSKSRANIVLNQTDEDFIYLIVTLKKVPDKSRTKAFKIPLAHELYDPNNSEICLITHDSVNKNDVTKKIQQENIPISKVIKFGKLKSDYRALKDKRKLCGSFDMFLADKRIVNLLPKELGRCFYKQRKNPVLLDLGKKDWKAEIESVCRSGMLYLRTGTCCVVKVGRVSMRIEHIVENIVAGINGVVDVVPSKWRNARSFHLKLLESLALPIYEAADAHGMLRIKGLKDVEGGGEMDNIKGNTGDVKFINNNYEPSDGDSDGDDSEGEDFDLGKLLDNMRKEEGKKDEDQKERMKVSKLGR